MRSRSHGPRVDGGGIDAAGGIHLGLLPLEGIGTHAPDDQLRQESAEQAREDPDTPWGDGLPLLAPCIPTAEDHRTEGHSKGTEVEHPRGELPLADAELMRHV